MAALRKVEQISSPPPSHRHHGKGFYYRLHCGHTKWIAGPMQPLRETECFEGPCYKQKWS